MGETIPALVLFDSQKLDLNPTELSLCRSILLLSHRLRPLLTEIGNLHSLWTSIVSQHPELASDLAYDGLQCLQSWLDGEDVVSNTGAKSSVFITTITLVGHITLYSHYLDDAGKHLHERILQRARHAGIQGFCTGLLAASAVSCSSSVDELGINAAWALQLAFLIGFLVDYDATKSAKVYCSIAVRYKAPTTLTHLRAILAEFPQTYISVFEAQGRVTITTPTPSDILIARLNESGIHAKQLALPGRFHTEDYSPLLSKLEDTWPLNHIPNLTFHVPVRSNSSFDTLRPDHFQREILRCILVEPCIWETTLTITTASFSQHRKSSVLLIGPKTLLPSTIQRQFQLETERLDFQRLSNIHPTTASSDHTPFVLANIQSSIEHNSVAVVGMGVRTSHANSLDEFWQMILDGQSWFEPMPFSRLDTRQLKRSKKDSKLWGTFVDNIDSFDHKFFHNSAREAASMDPQQRMLLEVAYQAMECSGYFGSRSRREIDIGCYLGVCSNDYNDNVACNPAGAFSTLGTLRAFLAGRISHFFGWTGASTTFDTACSSSAVAIHSACQALKHGECSMALAGGVSFYTSPYFYQNLEAGGFLSPSGGCRPFDASADGYVRGEGIGMVVLKRLDRAITDGDKIYGILAGTAVNQNSKSPGITVPSCSSQSGLFNSILSETCILPSQVDYVEAHGTGTKVGDPIEFSSIHESFVKPGRSHPLYVGSVKGNIGHLEGASGVISLIKVLLMLQANTIPPQASFQSLNPSIPQDIGCGISIARRPENWISPFRTAFVNNYGASGSNAAMLVIGSLNSIEKRDLSLSSANLAVDKDPFHIPILVTANSQTSLQSYCSALAKRKWPTDLNLEAIAHALDLTQNHYLPWRFVTIASNLEGLSHELSKVASDNEALIKLPMSTKPIIMVIGGQSNSSIYAELGLHGRSEYFKNHWSSCAAILSSLGYDLNASSQKEGQDFVRYQVTLFCLQYSSAQTWIDNGMAISSIVGHSLGQVTALCISESLTLFDGIRFILRRAQIIRDHWKDPKGMMMAVEAPLEVLNEAIASVSATASESSCAIEIACFNGPASFVVVSESHDLDRLSKQLAQHTSVRTRKLSVSHGFHSSYTDQILPPLEQLANSLHITKSVIPVELCSVDGSMENPTPHSLTMHIRHPVHYYETIQRLEKKFGECIWFDPGPKSPAIGMIRRCIDNKIARGHTLLDHGSGGSYLFADPAQTITALWKLGIPVRNYVIPEPTMETHSAILLPPYQFDKSRHWLQWINHDVLLENAARLVTQDPEALVKPKGYVGSDQDINTFSVNTGAAIYKYCVDGHRVLNRPLCPASMYTEITAQAIRLLSIQAASYTFTDINIASPLGLATLGSLQLTLSRNKQVSTAWNVEMKSPIQTENVEMKAGIWKVNFTATISVASASTNPQNLLTAFNLQKFHQLSASDSAEILQGKIIYDVFSRVTNYAPYYKGVRKMVSLGEKAIAHISSIGNKVKELEKAQTAPVALDNILQVAGLQINCLQPGADQGSVFVCGRIDQIIIMEDNFDWSSLQDFQVCLNATKKESRSFKCDLAVYQLETESPTILISGAEFVRLPMSALTKMLDGVSAPQSRARSRAVSPSGDTGLEPQRGPKMVAKVSSPPRSNLIKVKGVVGHLIDVSPSELPENQDLTELGIDSILVTEMLSDIHKEIGVELQLDQVASVRTIRDLVHIIDQELGQIGSSVELHNDVIRDDLDEDIPALIPDTSPNEGNSPASPKAAEFFDILSKCLEVDVNEITSNSKLSEIGADSLMLMEIVGELHKIYGESIDLDNLTGDDNVGQLYRLVLAEELDDKHQEASNLAEVTHRLNSGVQKNSWKTVLDPYESFNHVKGSFGDFAKQYGYAGFFEVIYPRQQRLVVDYVIDAFTELGVDLTDMIPGALFEVKNYKETLKQLYDQLCEMLKDEGLLVLRNNRYFRTAKSVDKPSTAPQYNDMINDFPAYAKEMELIGLFGRNLAGLMRGTKNAIQLLFHEKANRELLAEVYAHGPMYNAINELLAEYVEQLQAKTTSDRPLRILEIGGGTGGTTKHILQRFSPSWNMEYTFSDVSPSFVQNAKRHFSKNQSMKYSVIDIEQKPAEHLRNYFDLIISTNCIHATKNLVITGNHMHDMLNENGSVLLIEFTKNIPWFDLVFGFFDGWWLFEDGRTHALADIDVWQQNLLASGFQQVSWTDGSTQEEQTLRIVAGFCSVREERQNEYRKDIMSPLSKNLSIPRTQFFKKTFTYKQVDGLNLDLDAFVPTRVAHPGKYPVALMIHGGGHVMLSRNDIRQEQAMILLDLGFLPISIDYRLCPEVNIIDGPMTDVVDAYKWIKDEFTSLIASYIIPDVDRIAIVGWSTGGTLALQTSWTTVSQGLSPPAAILSFYCPTDYEDQFWQTPNYPNNSKTLSTQAYSLQNVLAQQPIAQYNVTTTLGRSGNWFSAADPRSRLVLHMNWTGQCLPVLLNGPTSPIFTAMSPHDNLSPQPSIDAIQSISPLAHAKTGRMRTPVFIVHGDADDLVPASQSQRLINTLHEAGTKAEIAIVPEQLHLFDVGIKLRSTDGKSNLSPAADAVWQGLWFLLANIGPAKKV